MQHERGVTLIITFIAMALMLGIVLSLSVMLFRQINIISSVGNSISSFYAAESGAEKTLYYDAKQVPGGATRGFCNMCNACTAGDCDNCSLTGLNGDQNGCDVETCNNCGITYTSYYDDKQFNVSASLTPDPSDPSVFIFDINARGYYRNSIRAVNLNVVE